MSPLHRAVQLGHLKVCEILLDYGKFEDIFTKDHQSRTPLHFACKHGFLSISQLLVRSGANINEIDEIGNTPMHYASDSGNKELVEWLLSRRPNLNIRNLEGKEPYGNRIGVDEEVKIGKINTCRIEIQTFEEQNVDVMMNSLEIPFVTPYKGNQKVQKVPIFIDEEDEIKENLKVGPSDFEALSLLGKGSFGEVFLVRKADTSELYAMKVLRKNKIMGQNLVRYAMTERNIMSFLKHPFIVSLKFAFQTSDKLYLILDYCPGGDLGNLINKQKFIPEEQAKIYVCEILLAIEELHDRDIIFRDLKPDNVVIDKGGHALLTDFGLSKEGVDDGCTANSFCGSVAYLAPEMLNRKGHGKSVD